jgi:NAD(P)-dependent dehydrogenase (short-subunit alcohol dehydrogenase family)
MEQTSEETYHHVMEVNYYGALHLSKAFALYEESKEQQSHIYKFLR